MIDPAALPTPLRASHPQGSTHTDARVAASLGHKASCAASKKAHPGATSLTCRENGHKPLAHPGRPDITVQTQMDTHS